MRLPSILLCALLPSAALAQSLTGDYHGRLDGTDGRLLLNDQDGRISGQYIEGALTFQVTGQFDGTRLDGTVSLAESDLAIARISGQLNGDTLRLDMDARNPYTGASKRAQADFHRRPAGASGPPVAGGRSSQGAAGPLDPRLVGDWHHEDMMNSGGGNFASFTTVLTLRLNADGSMEQYRESVGGGDDWSYDGGRSLILSGQWYARDGVIYVRARDQSDFVAATRYRFSDQYLVTEDANGRRIWQ